jgi:hypothetical protein
MRRRKHPGRLRAARVATALIAIGSLIATALAYAQAQPDLEGRRPVDDAKTKTAKKQSPEPPRPSLIEAPGEAAVGPEAQFRFHVAPRVQPPAGHGPTSAARAVPSRRWRQFECRLDRGAWEICGSPRRLSNLTPGDHAFAVRALDRRGRHGAAAHHAWTQLAPQRFAIEPLAEAPPELMPGEAPQPLPVRIVNPNPVPIAVTRLTVEIASDPPGCPADPNFELVPSSASPAAPVGVPAGGSVELPAGAATAPAIALRELPRDQNACQGATLPLVFRGEAGG